MKSGSAHEKANRNDTDARSRDISGGKNAVGLIPPASEIDFVNSGLPCVAPVQRIGRLDGAEGKAPLQGKFNLPPAQPRQMQPRPASNRTGMPDGLKAGVESLSGMDLSDVRVSFNSEKPAQLNALAYAQGNEIHLAPGQERHLPHEAWHVVQQRQGRVVPTMQAAGTPVNDDRRLEAEADRMGVNAMAVGETDRAVRRVASPTDNHAVRFADAVVQRVPTNVTITGVTHLVAPAGESIYAGTETTQVEHGDVVRIEPEESLWSRRGPNQEKHQKADEQGLHMYEWYKVLSVKGSVVTDDSYLRDETFVSAKPLRGSDVDEGLMRGIKTAAKEAVFAKAHGQGSAAEITAAQSEYQNWLADSMSTKEIMDSHRSVGFEYEFASYCKEDGKSPGLDAHIELGKSDELSPIFQMPFVLETDSEDELEAVTPPLLIADVGGEINRNAANAIYSAYKASLKALRDGNMPKIGENPKKKLVDLDYAASGLGENWRYTRAMQGLWLGKRLKHSGSTDRIYSQMNISLTAEEIADFTQTRSHLGERNPFAVVVTANTAVKKIFDTNLDGAFQVYAGEAGMSPNDARMAWQNVSTAVTNICKGLAGLVSIPSILAENEGIKGESLFSNVKEYCGMWIKDSIPNIVDSSLADPHSRSIMHALMVVSVDEVAEALGATVDGELKRIKAGVKEWFTWPFKTDSRADTKLAEYKKTFKSELSTTFEMVMTRLEKPAPRRVGTKGIPEYGGERFGKEGLGVRKDTFVNIASGEARTLHLAEMRNDWVIKQILKGRRRRGD